jgi:hypothetical protein
MTRKRTEAIARQFGQKDRDVTVINTPYDTVSHRRGLGSSGYRLEIVEYDCPHSHCSFDRMIRRVDIHPEYQDDVSYWCCSPNCPHFVGESVNYAMPSPDATEPTVLGDSDE